MVFSKQPRTVALATFIMTLMPHLILFLLRYVSVWLGTLIDPSQRSRYMARSGLSVSLACAFVCSRVVKASGRWSALSPSEHHASCLLHRHRIPRKRIATSTSNTCRVTSGTRMWLPKPRNAAVDPHWDRGRIPSQFGRVHFVLTFTCTAK